MLSRTSLCAACFAEHALVKPVLGKLELLGELPATANRNARIQLQCGGDRYTAELFDQDNMELGHALHELKDISKFEAAVTGLQLTVNGKDQSAVLFRELPKACTLDFTHPARVIEVCAQLFRALAKINAKGYSHHGLTPADLHITESGAILGSSNSFKKFNSVFTESPGANYYPLEKRRTRRVSALDDVFTLSLSLVELLNQTPFTSRCGERTALADFYASIATVCQPANIALTPVFDVLRQGLIYSRATSSQMAGVFKAMKRSVWSDVRIEKKLSNVDYEGVDLQSGRYVTVKLFENATQQSEVKKASHMLSHLLPRVYRSYAFVRSADNTERCALILEHITGSPAEDVVLDTTLLERFHLDHSKMTAVLVDGQVKFSNIVKK